MQKERKDLPTLYVMNSASMVYEVSNRLIMNKQEITDVFLFLDNDNAGEKATVTLLDMLEPHSLQVGTKNHLYKGWKDLSAWWMEKHAAHAHSFRLNALVPGHGSYPARFD